MVIDFLQSWQIIGIIILSRAFFSENPIAIFESLPKILRRVRGNHVFFYDWTITDLLCQRMVKRNSALKRKWHTEKFFSKGFRFRFRLRISEGVGLLLFRIYITPFAYHDFNDHSILTFSFILFYTLVNVPVLSSNTYKRIHHHSKWDTKRLCTNTLNDVWSNLSNST